MQFIKRYTPIDPQLGDPFTPEGESMEQMHGNGFRWYFGEIDLWEKSAGKLGLDAHPTSEREHAFMHELLYTDPVTLGVYATAPMLEAGGDTVRLHFSGENPAFMWLHQALQSDKELHLFSSAMWDAGYLHGMGILTVSTTPPSDERYRRISDISVHVHEELPAWSAAR